MDNARQNLNQMIEKKEDVWVKNPSKDMKISIRVSMEGILPAINPGECRCLSEELSYEQIDKSDLRKLLHARVAGQQPPLILLDPAKMKDHPREIRTLETPEMTPEDRDASRVKTTIIGEDQINARLQQLKLSMMGEKIKPAEALEELRRLEPSLQDHEVAFMQTGKGVPLAVKKWASGILETRQKKATSQSQAQVPAEAGGAT